MLCSIMVANFYRILYIDFHYTWIHIMSYVQVMQIFGCFMLN